MKFAYAMPLAFGVLFALTACQDKKAEEQATDTQAVAQSAEQATGIDTQISTIAGKQTLSANPKLAVYDMALMQNLAILGVPVAGMPADLPLFNLKAANTPDATDIGSANEPNLDALKTLAPQAIFVAENMPTDKLADIAPTHRLMTDSQNVLQSTKQQLNDFAQLFGKDEQAKQAIAELDTAIDKAKQAAANKGKGLVLLVDGQSITAFGKGSLYGFVHDAFGMPMADESVQGVAGKSLTASEIAAINPDWLFVIDRATATGQTEQTAEAVLADPAIAGTTAGQKAQIAYLSADSYLATGGYYQWLADAQIVSDFLSAQ